MIEPTLAPTAPSTSTSTRDRLLDAAARLFYQEGVGVGVETLCRTAGVSKRSMYQLFDSKDEVVAASLERIAPVYQAFLQPADAVRSPRARILHVFERLEEAAAAPDFRGCPFLAAAVEVKSPEHPASQVARRCKDELTAFFQREAEHAGAEDPGLLARQLTVVFDGSSARAVVQGQGLDGLAIGTARALLDAAGVKAACDTPSGA
ncbi:TetR/AcrR family transcriptional regulator [Actinomadura sp. NTSP31]|uniref:TetR/AcrR family transcriptional regulator n=1 Tax=Actinomadura sp. NTSP31 TaxID=1735447 RepID=UPI0035BF137D